MCYSSAGPCLLSPIPWPSTRADPLTRQVRVWAEKGIWDLVPGRSPVGWHWAHLKVLQTFASVFLRGLVTKNGLFTPRGHRDSTLSFWSLDSIP